MAIALNLSAKRRRIDAERRRLSLVNPDPRPATCWSGHALTWDGDHATCSAGHRFVWSWNMIGKMGLVVAWD